MINRLTFLTLSLLSLISVSCSERDYICYIDTRVGTAASETKTAGRFGKGTEEYAHTLPAVIEPNGMNFWTPQTAGATEKKGVCPYLYKEERLRGLRCSHWIVGGCTQDYGSFTIFPTDIRPNGLSDFSSAYSHDKEVATPSYYSAMLDDSNTLMEMTGRSHSAIFRLTYADADNAYLIVTVNSDEREGEMGIDEERHLIWGKNPVHRIYQGKGKPAGFSGWFVIEYQDGQIAEHGRIDEQNIWVRFNTGKVVIKAASSFTSVDNAINNLNTEIPHFSFDKTRKELTAIWNRHLSKIEVQSDDEDELCKFYGSLYRASFLPHAVSDCNGAYARFADGTPMQPDIIADGSVNGQTHIDYYDDFSMWDTYRALHPLLNIISPGMNGEMIQSLVTKYQQGGWLPIFPCWNSYTAAMIGDHCTSVIADAYVKGVRNFDAITAYQAMRKNAFQQPATYEEYCEGLGRRALASYLEYGYIPLEDSVKEAFHQHEQVSRTFEYAYDDYAVAQMAKSLMENEEISGIDHKTLAEDYSQLTTRSGYWKNVIDPMTGWANGRHADGSFVVPADTQYIKEPEKHPEAHSLTPYTFSTFITEGTPCHYTWYVPHDVAGLVEAMGGKSSFDSKLDEMFADGLYWHGNEPCHQIAYLYNYIDEPKKTQRAVRHILATEYMNRPGGLSGNDDAGQMSAWYIFSAMGFYPVCPGSTDYALGSPVFPKVDINLENGKTFTIIADNASPQNIFVESVTLNGQPLTKPFITHSDIMDGGVLHFVMTDK
ncbi:MAG: GH92 family glycosyl hydrolase [Bacteroidales bacterium]|nr:GH92 family glycosyl hydrolase [Candidatus Liminaster caballi]